MKTFLMLFSACVLGFSALAQNSSTIQIKDAKSNEPLSGATLTFLTIDKASSTNANGEASFINIAKGEYPLEIRFIGYHTKRDTVSFPIDTTKIILLDAAEEEELEEVIVSSTRSSRTIANIPTRIELIAGEELDEKGNMKPGDIRMLLNESTGIQTQQTSATSANASIRIQGLDGRYTQILKDGFPLYSGAASGLGLLQTPPLDLKQVEVIKGSASTLYGGGAIAGLVNLIRKTPGEEREINFHLNGTSAGGLDLNGFYSQRFRKVGITLFASRNSNAAYAPGNLDLTAIPKVERYTFNPKLFFYLSDKTELNIGINSAFENRIGGDLHYIDGEGDDIHRYFEQNKTNRLSTQFSLEHKINANSRINLKNSLSYFNRAITIPDYLFEGLQFGSFSEASYSYNSAKTEWVTGINLWTDHFKENQLTSVPLRDYKQTTLGAFVQNNIRASKWMELEAGLRGDYALDYGFVFLPRLSALFKISNKLSSRLGSGFGYKEPTIFTEESERIQYQKVLPVSPEKNKLEKSYGINWDINYRTPLFKDQVSFSINHLFFYTYLANPLMLVPIANDQYSFENLPGHLDTRGMETNLKLGYQDFKLFVGYSLTDTKIHTNGTLIQNPLTSKHRLNNVLMYEADGKWKLGAEAYYYSKQRLTDGLSGKPYWIFGFMAEKLWKNFSVYINFENFTDTRQTRFDSIYSGSITNPVFRDIYAPLDGFVTNGGIKLRL
ncbi:TonB-dependent receptor [Rubrolithibacter danxiaensis]|uniref:TonB-dependent receptor n=1 Tax=Rubrolithibacter danxiaensis TaxID=3390805 RepID=UPI003BF7F86A